MSRTVQAHHLHVPTPTENKYKGYSNLPFTFGIEVRSKYMIADIMQALGIQEVSVSEL